jgi:hypothetical protein
MVVGVRCELWVRIEVVVGWGGGWEGVGRCLKWRVRQDWADGVEVVLRIGCFHAAPHGISLLLAHPCLHPVGLRVGEGGWMLGPSPSMDLRHRAPPTTQIGVHHDHVRTGSAHSQYITPQTRSTHDHEPATNTLVHHPPPFKGLLRIGSSSRCAHAPCPSLGPWILRPGSRQPEWSWVYRCPASAKCSGSVPRSPGPGWRVGHSHLRCVCAVQAGCEPPAPLVRCCQPVLTRQSAGGKGCFSFFLELCAHVCVCVFKKNECVVM